MNGLVGQAVRWRHRDANGKSENPSADRGIVVAVNRRDSRGWELLVQYPNGQLLTWQHDDAEVLLPKADAMSYEALEQQLVLTNELLSSRDRTCAALETRVAEAEQAIGAYVNAEQQAQQSWAELLRQRDGELAQLAEAQKTIEKLSLELQTLKKKHRPKGQQGPESGASDTRGDGTTPEK